MPISFSNMYHAAITPLMKTIPMHPDVISPPRTFWDHLHRNCFYMLNENAKRRALMDRMECELQPCHKQAAFTCAVYWTGRWSSQLRSNYLSSHCRCLPHGISHPASPGKLALTAFHEARTDPLWPPQCPLAPVLLQQHPSRAVCFSGTQRQFPASGF